MSEPSHIEVMLKSPAFRAIWEVLVEDLRDMQARLEADARKATRNGDAVAVVSFMTRAGQVEEALKLATVLPARLESREKEKRSGRPHPAAAVGYDRI